MKKHKIIGLAIMLFVIFGVVGIAFYKQNVYFGINQVKAIDKSKLSNNTCSTSNTVVLDSENALSTKKINVKTTGDYEYTIDVYAIDVTTEPGKSFFLNIDDNNNPNSLNADQYFQPDQTIPVKGATNTTIDLNKYTDTGKLILVDVTWGLWGVNGDNDKGEECLKGSYVKMNRGKTTNSSENVSACQRWISGEKIEFNVDGESYTLNENLDQYDADKLAAFNTYKNSADVSKFCSTDNAFGGKVEEFMKVLKNMENGFEASYMSSSTTYTDSNPGINDKSAYEEVENTEIGTLYCKVNSVYLSDIDSAGENRLEDSNTEDKALKLADKDNKVDSSGSAKANLYQFKHSQDNEPVQYTVVSNGEKTSATACKVSCTEYVKVNFDPPQEVEAGTCFSYAVQVIAFTECNVSEKAAPPTPPVTSGLETVCVQNYIRNGEHPKSRFAGPEEDFDECISKCDGGKYSQKCSNKCFNEIYGDENAEVENNNSKVTGLSLLDKSVLGTFMDSASGDQCPGVNADYDTVRNFFKTHSSGTHYLNSSGQVDFKSNYPGCYWAQYAPYALNDANFDETWALDIHHTTASAAYAPNCVTDKDGAACKSTASWHNNIGAAGHGVKVRRSSCDLNSETPHCDLVCDAQCSYIASGPESSWNSSMASDEYEQTMANYTTAIGKCTADAACKSQDTTTSTFYIGVNDKEENEKTKWDATNDTGNTETPQHSGEGCITPDGKNPFIIQGRKSTKTEIDENGTGGLCYCGNEEYGEWHHYTRWTFPARWVDKKSTEVTDQPPKEGDENLYDGGYNKYCIDRKERENINIDWLKQYLTNKEQYSEDADARSHITEQNIESWNIFGGTKDFGNFGWDIDFKCFYSLATSSDIIDPPNDPSPDDPDDTTGGPDDPDTSVSTENVRIKTADLKNPIPKSGGTERKESWNWSDSATKMDVELDESVGSTTTYEIAPSSYRKYVEDLGDDVFKGNDYLDYQFKFTGSDLKKIADDVKTNNRFGDFSSGEFIPISGYKNDGPNKLSAYYSNYIRTTLKENLKKWPNKNAVVCNNLDSRGGNASKCSTTDTDITATEYAECFKENKRRREADPNAELLECEAEVLE